MASVQIRGIKKYFGGAQVIRGIDVNIEDGQFAVLVGPSGCGKSTLLRMLAGLEQISEGEIRIADEVVNNMLPKERDIAMVFQNYALYPHMTVYNNMAFSLMLAKVQPDDIKKRVDNASEILGLSQLLERYPRQLSGGQRQRVAMGRAIVRNPRVFLFDEPLSNLDAKLRVQMRAEIRSLHQRLKTTSVYVTHDQIEAMTMGDLIVVMNDGRVEQSGRPLDLYDRPENLFVAGFIGSPAMNFFKGVLRRDGTSESIELQGGTRLPLPESAIGAVHEGQQVVYGVRPEHLSVSSSGQGLATSVSMVEPTGANTEIHAELEGIEVVAVFRERYDLARGDTVHLLPDNSRAHLFDAESGRVIRARQ